MAKYLSSLIRSYFSSYTGLSKSCWEGIALNLFESIVGTGIFYFLSFYFVNVLKINITTAGFVISFYGLGAILGGLVGGSLSDKTSPETVSILSLLIQGIVYLTLIKLNSIDLLVMDLFFLGVSTYSFLTSNNVSVLSQCEDSQTKKLKAISILDTVSNFGLGFSALIISELSAYGFDHIFFGSGILLFLLASYLFFRRKQNKKFIKFNEVKSKNISDYKETGTERENKTIIWMILICLFFVGSIVVQMSTTYSIYIHKAFPQLGIKAFSIIFTLNTFLIVIFQTPVVNFFSNYNKILMVGIGAFLLGLGMFLLSFAYIFSFAIFSCVIYTAGEMLFFSMSQIVCYQKAAGNKKGRSLGMYRMVYASSRVIGPAVGGAVYHQFGGDMLWFLCGVIGFVCLIACSYYEKYD